MVSPPITKPQVQPTPRGLPPAVDRHGRHLQNFGRLIDRQSTEEPQLDDTSELYVDGFQVGQCLIQGQKVMVELGGTVKGLIEIDALSASTPLERPLSPSMIDQDVPHGLSSPRKKLPSVSGLGSTLLRQLDKSLVYQCRRYQGVVRILTTEKLARNGP